MSWYSFSVGGFYFFLFLHCGTCSWFIRLICIFIYVYIYIFMKLPCYKEGYAHVKCEANTWSYYPISIFFLYGCLGYCPLQLAVGSLQLLLWMSKHCCYLFWCLIFFFLFSRIWLFQIAFKSEQCCEKLV